MPRWTDAKTGLLIHFRPSPIEVGIALPIISLVTYWGGELFFHLIR
jgi:hypothetical protein